MSFAWWLTKTIVLTDLFFLSAYLRTCGNPSCDKPPCYWHHNLRILASIFTLKANQTSVSPFGVLPSIAAVSYEMSHCVFCLKAYVMKTHFVTMATMLYILLFLLLQHLPHREHITNGNDDDQGVIYSHHG